MGELLTLESLKHERSFGSFESVYLLDGALDDLLDAAAYEEVHTGRESQIVVLGRNGTAMNVLKYSVRYRDDTDTSRHLPGLQLRNDRSDFISSGHHPVGRFLWIDTSEQSRLIQVVNCNT
jgi:hypothetical protein